MADLLNQESEKDRLAILIASFLLIVFSIYFIIKDNTIQTNELTEIEISLNSQPQYFEYKAKTPAHIILQSKEYKKPFWISNFEYKTINLDSFQLNINKNDILKVKINKEDLSNLNNESLINNLIYIYGISKNNIEYINLTKTKGLKDEDSKIAYFSLILGFLMIPYIFLKKNVELRFEFMILTYIFLSVIAYSFLKTQNIF
ncbi:MAG: hypothetical protein E6Q46_06100 [Flavobacterium sp.]|nr:MAG: hypothetical protein E6Q46_06100 [Flavobacterium sp.]